MNMDTEPPRVGAALQALRGSRGLSLDDLSKRAGVSKSMLSQIERNQANPTVAVVWRLANALGRSPSGVHDELRRMVASGLITARRETSSAFRAPVA
jgi:transcriptional regulator with XRE-family HTH domain